MPAFPIHFAALPHDSFPPIDTRSTVDVDEPLTADSLGVAVKRFLASARGPQTQGIEWARIVLNTHPNGQPRQVARGPVAPGEIASLDWHLPRQADE
jgi:hypothetical protein